MDVTVGEMDTPVTRKGFIGFPIRRIWRGRAEIRAKN
jgi:hypothetical protein